MRQILVILFLVLFPATQLWAQTPQLLNYQAVARNSTGQIIPSQNVGVRFSVLEGSVNGTELYKETHSTTTNNFGLFTLFIGGGTVATGTFSSIDWSTGTKFLKVEIAPAGGTNYTVQGTTQLLSVPYALYAEKTKLLAGNNTISISNGNTITGNYQPGNNTITITGNTIAGNYQPGTGININSNTISHNLQAGSGISINGNTISSTGTGGNSLWIADANGQHSATENVGIGSNSVNNTRLSLRQVTTNNGTNAAMDITSSDSYHTVVRFRNENANQEWQFQIPGTTNQFSTVGSYSIYNGNLNSTPFKIVPGTLNIAIGSTAGVNNLIPRSRLHIFNGDVNIDQIGSGIIMKSPNGNCWRITIDNSGNLVRTAITCP